MPLLDRPRPPPRATSCCANCGGGTLSSRRVVPSLPFSPAATAVWAILEARESRGRMLCERHGSGC